MSAIRVLGRLRRRKIGIALGSGGARGWAHVGVLKALRDLDIEPQIVAGTSMGALVGGVYCAGGFEALESIAGSLDWLDILYHFWDPAFHLSGLIDGRKVARFVQRMVSSCRIEDLPVTFIAVATDLHTGGEVHLKEGDLIEAIRASISVPALFTPVESNGRLLVDGGLVNPVPTDVAAEAGADLVIAVELNLRDLDRSCPTRWRRKHGTGRRSESAGERSVSDSMWSRRIRDLLAVVQKKSAAGRGRGRQKQAALTMVDVLGRALRVMESKIAEQRLDQFPPDVLIQPDLQDIGFIEHHRATEIIKRGYAAAREVLEAEEA
ncbi:MAG TPA: patatin [Kiritimatiellae bacterium]|nr:patatin [Kiritimatiellia bacterium]